MNTKNLDNWWAEPAEKVLEALDVDPQRGLTEERVEQMRERYGANTMVDTEPTSLRELLWESLTSPMMLLLLGVAAVSLLVGQYREAIVMAVVVLIYVGVELYNKYRTDRTLARLRELQAPKIIVLRGGKRREVEVNDVVVGDVLPLQAGSRIPADGRLLTTTGLLVNEAPLTGESAPQAKDAQAEVAAAAALAERPTAVFAGTTVLDGQGKAVVIAVGNDTELGQVAELSARAEQEPTPLQEEMDDLANTLAYVAVGVSLLIPLVGLLRGYGLREMVMTWLSLTFLMVPGQPPIIITMALALAAFELAKKNVIVSRLRGAETLGSVTTIVSDKTGTLTENEMALAAVILPSGSIVPPPQAPTTLPEDIVPPSEKKKEGKGTGEWRRFLSYALPAIPEHSQDPTDEALLNAAAALDSPPEQPLGELIDQTGFARNERYRSLIYRQEGERIRYLTGSPDFILERATRAGPDRAVWEEEQQEIVQEQVAELAAEGYRITAYAYVPQTTSQEAGEPQELVFTGCAVLEDPIREEVPQAISELREAGVRTLLVTGDNPATARHVAQQIGLESGSVLTGREIAELEDTALEEKVASTDVFARTTPEQKLRIVQALQERGETVAVTGDGVNDAPALRTAHIGVAMGETGTDVAREAAELVLTDDNFAHLPDGVQIGRKAYDNFRKGLTYYLSAKAILLTAFLVPLAVGREFPFAPIQIIAIELLMDLASSTIFISEAAEPGLMEQKPRTRTRFLSWEVGQRILRNMAGLTVAILVAYFASFALGHDLTSARTAAFATWLLGHIVLALNLKQQRIPLLKRGLFANRFAVGWLAGMVILVLAMTLIPWVQNSLDTTALSATQWAIVIAGALLASSWMEVVKWVRASDD